MPGGEFQDAVEHHSAAARVAAVEPEGELVQVSLQVRRFYPALVGAQQPPLAQRGDPVDGGQQFTGVLAAAGRGLLVAPLVGVAQGGQAVIAMAVSAVPVIIVRRTFGSKPLC